MRLPLLLTCLALAACSGPPPTRVVVPPAAVPDRVGIAYRTVSVLNVDLPTYASVEDIAVAQPGGLVETTNENIWADDPQRAITLELARVLAQITRATVAPQPWPFQDDPEAVVDVRLETAVAQAGGQFRMSGQYFVAPRDAGRPDRARLFSIDIPFDPEGGFAAIARAGGQAVSQLAVLIARDGLR